jgi:hypothetical protein
VSTKSIDSMTNATTPFNSRNTCVSLARKIIPQRNYDVTGDNNYETNIAAALNAYYVAPSAPERISIDRANNERFGIWRGEARVGLKQSHVTDRVDNVRLIRLI